MPVYLYACPEGDHGLIEVRAARPTVETCPECGARMRRDWKAEGANVNIANLRAAH